MSFQMLFTDIFLLISSTNPDVFLDKTTTQVLNGSVLLLAGVQSKVGKKKVETHVMYDILQYSPCVTGPRVAHG